MILRHLQVIETKSLSIVLSNPGPLKPWLFHIPTPDLLPLRNSGVELLALLRQIFVLIITSSRSWAETFCGSLKSIHESKYPWNHALQQRNHRRISNFHRLNKKPILMSSSVPWTWVLSVWSSTLRVTISYPKWEHYPLVNWHSNGISLTIFNFQKEIHLQRVHFPLLC